MEILKPEKKKPETYLPEVKEIIASDEYIGEALEKIKDIGDEENTFRHTQRAANLGCLLWKYLAENPPGHLEDSLKFTKEKMRDFIEICLLHDIGKTELEDKSILKRPKGEFSKEDWEAMSQHARKGYNILKRDDRRLEIANLVLLHHEFQERSYPEISIEAASITDEDVDMARFMAMVDVSDRYMFGAGNIDPLPPAEAEEKLKKQFSQSGDAEIIDFLLGQYERIKELGGD